MRIISGHVAMTIMAAHTIGTRNGRMIHTEAMSSPTMNSTPSVSCIRSRRGEESPMVMIFVSVLMVAAGSRPYSTAGTRDGAALGATVFHASPRSFGHGGCNAGTVVDLRRVIAL
jgi:hypothetical protein